MSKRTRSFFIMLGIVLTSVLILQGCNIFSAFGNITLGNYNNLMAKADAAYQSGDYATATDKYSQAIEVRPESSEARVGYVYSLSKFRYVDFLYIAQAVTQEGADLSALVNDVRVKNNLLGASGVFSETISCLTNITEGYCDGVIPTTDISVNIHLALSYLLRGLVMVADSNGDDILGGSGDLLVITADGIDLNEELLSIDAIASNLANAGTNANSGLSTNVEADPFALIFGTFSSVSDVSSLTNLTVGTQSDYRFFLEAIHGTIDLGLITLSLGARALEYVNKATEAISRVATLYTNNELVSDLVVEFEEYNDMLISMENDMNLYGGMFSTFHQDITGRPAFTGAITSYDVTTFSYHIQDVRENNPLGGLMDVMFLSPGTGLGLTSASNLQDVLLSAASQISNLLNNSDFSGLLDGFLSGMSEPTN